MTFSVSAHQGRSVQRVDLRFPHSLALVTQGEPLVLQISLQGLLEESLRDPGCGVHVVLRSVVDHSRPPNGGNSFSTPQHEV